MNRITDRQVRAAVQDLVAAMDNAGDTRPVVFQRGSGGATKVHNHLTIGGHQVGSNGDLGCTASDAYSYLRALRTGYELRSLTSRVSGMMQPRLVLGTAQPAFTEH